MAKLKWKKVARVVGLAGRSAKMELSFWKVWLGVDINPLIIANY